MLHYLNRGNCHHMSKQKKNRKNLMSLQLVHVMYVFLLSRFYKPWILETEKNNFTRCKTKKALSEVEESRIRPPIYHYPLPKYIQWLKVWSRKHWKFENCYCTSKFMRWCPVRGILKVINSSDHRRVWSANLLLTM